MPMTTFPVEHRSSVVAGPYTGSWKEKDLGHITADGYRLSYNSSSYPITADLTGENTIIDRIFSGITMQVSFTLEHWNAPALEELIWWFGTGGTPANTWELGKTDGVGLRHFEYAKALVLQSCHFVAGATPTAAASNATIDPLEITFPRTMLADGQNLEILLATRPRYIPIVMDVFPVDGDASPGETSNDQLRVKTCSKLRYFFATRNLTAYPATT